MRLTHEAVTPDTIIRSVSRGNPDSLVFINPPLAPDEIPATRVRLCTTHRKFQTAKEWAGLLPATSLHGKVKPALRVRFVCQGEVPPLLRIGPETVLQHQAAQQQTVGALCGRDARIVRP
jgi:hypothetical protein